jgi:hypothetical protein
MSIFYRSASLLFLLAVLLTPLTQAAAADLVSQDIMLEPGWNIVSTPMVLESHTFSADETAENFDIYLLDPGQPTGWATMADLGQTEFEPLFGYFINNKTGVNQQLTFNFASDLPASDRLFERVFDEDGWYSIGVADSAYAVDQQANRTDTDNPSKVLSLLAGKHDRLVDFTDAQYVTDPRSVAVQDDWKVAVPEDLNELNDLRETKGYAIYIKEAGARLNGTQGEPGVDSSDNVLGDEELVVRSSSNNPDSTTLRAEDDSDSDWYTIFVFELDPGDSNNEITLTSIPVSVTVSTSTFSQIVDDAELEIGGVTLDAYAVVGGETGTAVLTFDVDVNVRIFPEWPEDVELRLKFNALDAENEGVTVQAAMNDVDAIVAESIDGELTAGQLSGSATGESHTLRTKGIEVELQEVDEDMTSVDGPNNDYAEFQIEMEVTAFEQDVYISTDPSSISWRLLDDNDSLITDTENASTTVMIDSTADEEMGFYIISEGETEVLTIRLTYTPGALATQMVRLQLLSLTFDEHGTESVADDSVWLAEPLADYRTGHIIIVD